MLAAWGLYGRAIGLRRPRPRPLPAHLQEYYRNTLGGQFGSPTEYTDCNLYFKQYSQWILLDIFLCITVCRNMTPPTPSTRTTPSKHAKRSPGAEAGAAPGSDPRDLNLQPRAVEAGATARGPSPESARSGTGLPRQACEAGWPRRRQESPGRGRRPCRRPWSRPGLSSRGTRRWSRP